MPVLHRVLHPSRMERQLAGLWALGYQSYSKSRCPSGCKAQGDWIDPQGILDIRPGIKFVRSNALSPVSARKCSVTDSEKIQSYSRAMAQAKLHRDKFPRRVPNLFQCTIPKTRKQLEHGKSLWKSLTLVAGPTLLCGNLPRSPNLQARFCKLYPADFSVASYLFVCC